MPEKHFHNMICPSNCFRILYVVITVILLLLSTLYVVLWNEVEASRHPSSGKLWKYQRTFRYPLPKAVVGRELLDKPKPSDASYPQTTNGYTTIPISASKPGPETLKLFNILLQNIAHGEHDTSSLDEQLKSKNVSELRGDRNQTKFIESLNRPVDNSTSTTSTLLEKHSDFQESSDDPQKIVNQMTFIRSYLPLLLEQLENKPERLLKKLKEIKTSRDKHKVKPSNDNDSDDEIDD